MWFEAVDQLSLATILLLADKKQTILLLDLPDNPSAVIWFDYCEVLHILV